MTQEATNPYRTPAAPITGETPAPPVQTDTYYWSRAPGRIVGKFTGKEAFPIRGNSLGPMFGGSVRDWYETLPEVINDAALALSKVHSQEPTILEVSPNILSILECVVAYRSVYYASPDSEKITMKGAVGEYVGVLNNKYHVHVGSFPADTAKLVLVTDKKITKKIGLPKVVEAQANGKAVPSNFQGDWTTDAYYETEQLPALTRLDGRTFKILDL